MARSLASKPNVVPPGGDFPYGRLKDRVGAVHGTKVNENAYGDIHQFFERLMDVAGIIHNGLPDNDYSGFQFFEALLALVGPTYRVIVPIGFWNMDSTAILNVPHGIADHTKIRSVAAVIIDDAGSATRINLGGADPSGSGAVGGNVYSWNATEIALVRTTGGVFDNVNYDSGAVNRGYITIEVAR